MSNERVVNPCIDIDIVDLYKSKCRPTHNASMTKHINRNDFTLRVSSVNIATTTRRRVTLQWMSKSIFIARKSLATVGWRCHATWLR